MFPDCWLHIENFFDVITSANLVLGEDVCQRPNEARQIMSVQLNIKQIKVV